MEEVKRDLIQSLDFGERVSSNYTEIYLDDAFCGYQPPAENNSEVISPANYAKPTEGDWVSPSDVLLSSNIDLMPPFTSRIHRGTTHKGILEIGGEVLQRERDKFLKYLEEVLADNDSAWSHIQKQEKTIVAQKVKAIYERIFEKKSATMQKEISMFYEDTLREMEKHVRTEVRSILIAAHCSIISDLNKQIGEKLRNEKSILEKVLRKIYVEEIRKINKYYSLLLHNEKYRSNEFLNQALKERNDSLKTFCKQIEIDSATSTMYVMCTQRKKCRMTQFLLENFHTREIEEKLRTIKDKQNILNAFCEGKKQIFDINKEWEEKVRKILQLFLKFISFSLKLLPEQTTFLLDLEKLVVLQLNEILKHPERADSILKTDDDIQNLFNFHELVAEELVCEKDPFVIEGDLSPSIPTPYGSRETLPSHVDLPFVRLQRQFIYAKCQKMDQVRAYLESLRCKCRDPLPKESSQESVTSTSTATKLIQSPNVTPKSSDELFMVNDIQRLNNCPKRGCHSLAHRMSFPNLTEYLDFDEEKYLRVETILGQRAKLEASPKLTDPKEIINRDLLFAKTSEPYHTVETQYSSQEDINQVEAACDCMIQATEKHDQNDCSTNKDVDVSVLLEKRKVSLMRMVREDPKLLKLFTEESFDFVY